MGPTRSQHIKYDLQAVYDAVTPGITYSLLAEKTNVPRNYLDSLLATLEYNGFLLSEERGRLYPFETRAAQ